jgi:predicted Zn-dependent protease
MRKIAAFIILAVVTAGGAPAADPIAEAFARLYNFDFLGAHATLDRHAAAWPEDPMPHSVRAAVDLFYELDRLGILESEFFANNDRITDKKKLKPDPAVRERFFRSIETAQSTAQAVLKETPDDPQALYALCMTHGVLVDYVALVDRRQFHSLSLAKHSNGCAQKLLRTHPGAYDAYVTTGFTEYLAGSLPFFVRWFVKFENVQGSKERAIENLRTAAASGRYLGPFAKILLSIIYLREKKPEDSARMLEEFARDYPENALVRRELAKLAAQSGQAPFGQK